MTTWQAVHRRFAAHLPNPFSCSCRLNVSAGCRPVAAASQDATSTTWSHVTAVLENAGDPQQYNVDRTAAQLTRGSSQAVHSSKSKEPLYKAILAIILKLSQQQTNSDVQPATSKPQQQDTQQVLGQQQDQQQQQQEQQQSQQQRLQAFLRGQPVATSIPFISWLADLEAQAAGATKAQLTSLCEALMGFREYQDREGMEQLYSETLGLLSGGDEQVTALMTAEPRQYALALAEGLTGKAVILKGFNPAYDVLLQVAPPAALTPSAVTQGHALGQELGRELAERRKTTLAAMLGRRKMTQEQQLQLMGATPAARICDLLLTLGSSQERLVLLPDCFTPPADAATSKAAAAGHSSDGDSEASTSGSHSISSNASGGRAAGNHAEGIGVGSDETETEDLWCTPMQLLNEIKLRLKAAEAAKPASDRMLAAIGDGAGSSSTILQPLSTKLLGGNSSSSTRSSSSSVKGAGGQVGSTGEQLTGAAATAALRELQVHISNQWLDSLLQVRKVT